MKRVLGVSGLRVRNLLVLRVQGLFGVRFLLWLPMLLAQSYRLGLLLEFGGVNSYESVCSDVYFGSSDSD